MRTGPRCTVLRGVLLLFVSSAALGAGVFQCQTDAGGQCLFEVDFAGHATSRLSGVGNCSCQDILKLNHAGIKTLSPNVFALPGLRRSVTQVWLQGNEIERMQPGIFEPFTGADANIKVLRLDQNKLGTLPAGILSPFSKTLDVLVLSSNPIGSLDPFIFLPLARLAQLYVLNLAIACLPEIPKNSPPVAVTRDTGTEFCIECKDAGQTLYPGDNFCKQCLPGSYSPQTTLPKFGNCTACPPNTMSQHGSTSVNQCTCAPGFTGPDGGICIPCSPGTFKDSNGTTKCLNCPNYTSSTTASTRIRDCLCIPGYSIIRTGEQVGACGPCGRGFYKAAKGSALCR
jgi:hypothetical protein